MKTKLLAATLALAGCAIEGNYTGLPDAYNADASPDGMIDPAALTVSPGGDVAIGDVVIGQASGPTTLTVANAGGGTSGAIAIMLDDDTLGFEIVDDACSGMTLSDTQTCTFAVRLAPETAGALATDFHVVADPGGDVRRGVSGTGLTPGVVDLVEASHDFSALAVDAAAGTVTLTVRNLGQVAIGTPMPSISGNAAYAVEATTCTAPLGQADTCTVTVAFDPATVGAKAGALTVTSNAGGGASAGGQDAIGLAGTGIAAVSVSRTGTGAGSVSSTQPGINCGSACDADFASSPVTLMAQADLGSTFTGWSVDCAGTGTCSLDLTGAKTVTAQFELNTYPLTVVQSGTGAGSIGRTTMPSGAPSTPCGAGCLAYPYQTTVTLTPSASAGSTFAGWSGDCGGTGACVVTMDQAHAVTATFTLDTYPLTVTRGGTGSGVIASNVAGQNGGIDCGTACSDVYNHNQVVVLTATPAVGTSSVSWAGCTSSTATTCNVTMNQARNVTATFALGSYPLSVSRIGTGSVASVDGNLSCPSTCGHAYAFGTMVTLDATPGTGWHFDHWIGGPCDASTAPTCMLSIPASSTTTQAVFAIDQVPLTVMVTGTGTGSVASSPSGITCPGTCTDTFDHGTPVTLTATPTGGSSVSWSGCDATMGNTCTVNLTAARTVTTTFSSGPQTLTVTKAGNGSGTVSSTPAGISCGAACAMDSASFAFNTSVTLVASPVSPATFAGWSGGGCAGTGDCTVTMNQARSVTATFSAGAQLLTWTASGTGAGSLSVVPSQPPTTCPMPTSCYYPYNTTVTITESPAAGSSFVGWSGDCTGSGTSCVVAMTQSRSVDAEFRLVTRRLTVALGGAGGGTVTPSPVGDSCGQRCWDYPHGAVVTLTATPDASSTFTGWSSCPGTGTCQVTMTADTAVTATFVPNHTLTVTVNGDGEGTVTGTPGGIACTATGGTCTASYPLTTPATQVTLIATVGTESLFTGWGGACTGTTTCTVTMSQARSVTASFVRYRKLTVSTTGGGSGNVGQSVTNGSAGGSCGTGCTFYTSGSLVSLTATPTGTSYFAGWTGACQSQGATCNLTMDGDKTTTASFGLTNRLLVNKTGSGTVTSNDGLINCGPTCSHNYVPAPMVTLTATANPGSVFAGWNGACSGTSTCTVTMDMERTVTASFNYNLNKGTSGNGTISSSAGGLACTPASGYTSCTSYPPGTVVTVTNTPATGHYFSGWSGACSGTGTCSLTLNAERSVTASFTPTSYPLSVMIQYNGGGNGTVTSAPAGITCGIGGSACNASFPFNSQVALTADPDPMNGRFVQWTAGPCTGSTNPICVVTIAAANNSATAQFDWFAWVRLLQNNGSPNLASRGITSPPGAPAQINCTTTGLGGVCEGGFPKNTVLTVTYQSQVTGANGQWSNCRNQGNDVVVQGNGGVCLVPTGIVPPALGQISCTSTLSSPGVFAVRADIACVP